MNKTPEPADSGIILSAHKKSPISRTFLVWVERFELITPRFFYDSVLLLFFEIKGFPVFLCLYFPETAKA